AEGDEHLGMLDDARPCGDAPRQGRIGTYDVRQQELRAAPAVVALLVYAAPALEIEAPDQRTRMVQTAGGRPAVGPAEQSLRPIFASGLPDFLRDQIQGDIPVHFDEAVPAPLGSGEFVAVFKPRFSDGGLAYPFIRIHHVRYAMDDRRRIGIVREGLAGDEPAPLHD